MTKQHRFAGIALILAAGLLIYAQNPVDKATPVRAFYINSSYAYETFTEQEVIAFLEKLAYPDHLYMFGVGVNHNGTLTDGPWGNFIDIVHDVSDVKVMLAVGETLHYNEGHGDRLKVNDTATMTLLRHNLVDHVAQQHYDGLISDLEPIQSGDQDYKAWLIALKKDLGPKHVGAYGFRIDDKQDNIDGDGLWEWHEDYYAELSPHVDSIQLALYNQRDRIIKYYGGYTVENYQEWIKNMTRRIDAMGLENVYYGMSKYPDSPAHYSSIERIRHQWPVLIDQPTFVFTDRWMSKEDYYDYYAFVEAQQNYANS